MVASWSALTAFFRRWKNENGPRVLFAKQHFDVFGPWKPIQFDRASPIDILRTFAFKPTYWEMTCALRADWAIVKSEQTGQFRDYVESFARLRDMIPAQERFSVVEDVLDFDAYDIVISLEPFLQSPRKRRWKNTAFFYFMNEHSNENYNAHRAKPAEGYAGFLDHMCGTTGDRRAAHPNSIEMPYLRSPEVARSCFPKRRRHSTTKIWIEARTIILAATGQPYGTWTDACDAYCRQLQNEIDCPLVYRGHLYADFYNVPPPERADAVEYYKQMRNADIFIGLNAAGAGQTLCDAASLGLACFGTPNLIYHSMICEPDLLCNSLQEALQKASKLARRPGQMKSILTKQDERLRQHMNIEPTKRLTARARSRRRSV
jgi:hypothetical protein